jgi:hypothetical protein
LRGYVEVGESKERKKLIFQADEGENPQFGQYDSFDEYFAEKYIFSDGEPLDSRGKSKISTSYSQKKNIISKSLVEEWNIEDYRMYDLKDQLSIVMEFIKRANGL